MVDIDLTYKARKDLERIKNFIDSDNPERAITYTEGLLNRFIDIVSAFPLSCPRYSKRKNARRFVYGEYNIYYSYKKELNLIEILHIYHSSQLINSIFLD